MPITANAPMTIASHRLRLDCSAEAAVMFESLLMMVFRNCRGKSLSVQDGDRGRVEFQQDAQRAVTIAALGNVACGNERRRSLDRPRFDRDEAKRKHRGDHRSR